MAALPDEIWMHILHCGVRETFSCRSFCTISLVSRQLRRLSKVDSLWKGLWEREWPSGNGSDSTGGHQKGNSGTKKSSTAMAVAANRGILSQLVFDEDGKEHVDAVQLWGAEELKRSSNGRFFGKRKKGMARSHLEINKDEESGRGMLESNPTGDGWKERYRISLFDHLRSNQTKYLISSPPFEPAIHVKEPLVAFTRFPHAVLLRYERERDLRRAAHQRQVLRAKSRTATLEADIRTHKQKLAEEQSKLRAAASHAKELDRARQAKEAVKRWQPMAIATRQQQVVEQTPSSADAQREEARQELAVAREGVRRFTKSLEAKQALLEVARKEVEILTYNPMQEQTGELPVKEAESETLTQFIVTKDPESSHGKKPASRALEQATKPS